MSIAEATVPAFLTTDLLYFYFINSSVLLEKQVASLNGRERCPGAKSSNRRY